MYLYLNRQNMILDIKRIRTSKKISISKLAKITGVSRSYLSEIESGIYSNPGINTVCKICKALHVSPNELVNKDYWK